MFMRIELSVRTKNNELMLFLKKAGVVSQKAEEWLAKAAPKYKHAMLRLAVVRGAMRRNSGGASADTLNWTAAEFKIGAKPAEPETPPVTPPAPPPLSSAASASKPTAQASASGQVSGLSRGAKPFKPSAPAPSSAARPAGRAETATGAAAAAALRPKPAGGVGGKGLNKEASEFRMLAPMAPSESLVAKKSPRTALATAAAPAASKAALCANATEFRLAPVAPSESLAGRKKGPSGGAAASGARGTKPKEAQEPAEEWPELGGGSGPAAKSQSGAKNGAKNGVKSEVAGEKGGKAPAEGKPAEVAAPKPVEGKPPSGEDKGKKMAVEGPSEQEGSALEGSAPEGSEGSSVGVPSLKAIATASVTESEGDPSAVGAEKDAKEGASGVATPAAEGEAALGDGAARSEGSQGGSAPSAGHASESELVLEVC